MQGFQLGRNCLKNFIQNLLQDQSGQGLTEYVLLLSFCVIGASTLARGILKVIDQGILKLGGQLEKDLKTGRAPLSAWRN